jgi:hypothetical protein
VSGPQILYASSLIGVLGLVAAAFLYFWGTRVKRTRLYRKSRLRRKGIVNKPYVPKHDPGRLAFRIAVLAKGGCVLAGREDMSARGRSTRIT